MRSAIGLILIVNLALSFIIIGLASWSLNQNIDLTLFNKHLGGNTATIFVLIYALLGGVIGALSVIAGFIHLRAWSRHSLGIASSPAFVSLAATTIAFGLVIKEIAMAQGQRGVILKTLEAVIIASTFFQLLYLLLLHSGMSHSKHGPAFV